MVCTISYVSFSTNGVEKNSIADIMHIFDRVNNPNERESKDFGSLKVREVIKLKNEDRSLIGWCKIVWIISIQANFNIADGLCFEKATELIEHETKNDAGSESKICTTDIWVKYF